uniref:Nucleoprotein n=1 Tax=Hymenopteran phasma-related virus OKIAV233 TaxID=2792587 RepID=A0A7T0M3L8_9VIRU|nr:nucleoprotein [Hymenopteran phasma-related virus OKIAV233]
MTTRAPMATYSIAGSKPGLLLAHTVAKEYQIVGVTAQEFLDKHTGMDFDLLALRNEFKKHCPDYMEQLILEQPSKSVDFCSKVIYEVGPESRKVKKGTGDKVWKFIFKVAETDHTVFIATYKQENAEFKTENTPTSMILSLKQSALIAHETLARLVKIGLEQNKVLLTPLAGACFSKEDLDTLALELQTDKLSIINKINQSTQGGGHYLAHCDIDFAICAGFAATKNVKDENLKKSIIIKMIKQYMTKGHSPDKDRIRIISRFSTGGVPSEFSYETINELITYEQKSYALIKLKKLEVETATTSTVDSPPIRPKK